MDQLLKTMRVVCNRPGMYVGPSSMPRVRAFLDGYVLALGQSGDLKDYPFGGFLRWLEQKSNICHPAWGWDRILVHIVGSEKEAIRVLPDEFEKYLADLSSGKFDVDKVHPPTREPDQTCTEGYIER
jgi:hypothetical protein